MEFQINKVPLAEFGNLREDFLRENDIQFVLDKAHSYGWADTYLFSVDGVNAGYGAVWGKDKREDRDTIFEFYMVPEFIKYSNQIFSRLISVSGVTYIECQSNDRFLAPMFFEFAHDILAEAILFDDGFQSNLSIDGAVLVSKGAVDEKTVDVQYVLKHNDEIVASGGLMLNYNFPYADIYYGVEENHRLKGFGSFIVQELKKEAYRIGRVPSARCNITNAASKRTMTKVGLKICGWRMAGKIRLPK